MKDRRTLRAIKKMAKLMKKINALQEKMDKLEFFEGLLQWGCVNIYPNCSIKDGVLYDREGDELCRDGGCMNESVPCFVNQHTGRCGDDYYGTMYVKVDSRNTFVAINYEC